MIDMWGGCADDLEVFGYKMRAVVGKLERSWFLDSV